jgi:hypothetical protein
MTPKAGSVQRLVWPAAWQALASRTSVGVVVTLSVTAFLVVLGITADRMVEVAFASVGAVLFAILATYAYLTTLQAQRRSRDHIGVVAVGSSSSTTFMNQLLVIEMAYLAMALTAAALLFLVPSLVDQMPRTGTWNDMRLHSLARYSPVLACYSAALLLSPLVRKRRQLGLGLGSDGVYNWTWFGSCFFAWDWITEIRPSAGRELGVDLVVRVPDDRPSNPEENWLGRANFFRRRKSRIQVGYLAVNPAVAFYALRFYHRHPELRTELGTDAAAQRIRAGDLEA